MREKSVIAEMTRLGRTFGRWPTVREVGDAIANREKKPGLSVASTFRALAEKGYLIKEGNGYAVRGYRVKVRKAVVVKG